MALMKDRKANYCSCLIFITSGLHGYVPLLTLWTTNMSTLAVRVTSGCGLRHPATPPYPR